MNSPPAPQNGRQEPENRPIPARHPLDAPVTRRAPRETNLRKNTLTEIHARGGWAFATTGVAEGGIPDIVGAHRGIPLALELKTPTGQPSARQRRHLRLAAAAGAQAHLIRSLAQLRELLDRIEKENPCT